MKNLAEAAGTDQPTITVENSRIKIESGAFKSKAGLVSLSGFHGVLLEDPLAVSTGDATATWAIYTDIETRRGVLEHYYNQYRESNKPSEFEFPDVLFERESGAENDNLGRTYTTTAGRTADTLLMSGSIAATADDGTRRVVTSPDIPNGDVVTIRRNPGASFSASVRGVSGSFICQATSECTFTVHLLRYEENSPRLLAPDPFTFTQADWVFRAGSQPQIAIPGGDREFMYFGWRIQTPDSSGGTYKFEPRLGGMGLTDSPTFIGEARYTGPATGRYVKEDRAETVESDGQQLTVATSGIFTADATLIATDASVSGNVRNFREGGRSLGDWAVLLDQGGTTSLQVGDTKHPDPGPSAGQDKAGDWGVEFVPSRVGGNSPTTAGADENPVAAVGYFDAALEEVLHVSGAFGAKRQGN